LLTCRISATSAGFSNFSFIRDLHYYTELMFYLQPEKA
jgi:hypothetical protein